ncbi:methyltransferase domain-containing protein [Roseococcus microcysteis]|uniref:methyltransferase domain-containing protein n=1 Tax=Roseococcus microcysteis TaxID=2771361 RepID=UPI00168ABB1F|nr:methyltransferase domain-containing protein [Roseococcus microcysteis]
MKITAQDLLRRGAERHRAGKVEEAESLYRRALRLAPGHPDAENLLSVCALQRGDTAAAVEHSARALAVMPDSAIYLANHGAALAAHGMLPEAVATLQAALEREPDDVTSLRNLGQVLTAGGQPEAALGPLREAHRLAPASPEVALTLAHAAHQAGEAEEARAAAQAVKGPLAAQAGFLLAALGEAPLPPRAPAAFVREMFDAFAPRFDQDLAEALDYQTPALLAALLQPGARGRVLDLGCGTGLSGVALKPFAKRLEGLDLSPRMLDRARARGLYDAVHEADLLDFLPRRAAAYDLITAADVLNYLGDLAPALAAIAAALKPGGEALFSIETGAAQVELGQGLRFRHDPAHVASLAEVAGLTPLRREPAVLRQEKGAPVEGALFLLRRQPAPG